MLTLVLCPVFLLTHLPIGQFKCLPFIGNGFQKERRCAQCVCVSSLRKELLMNSVEDSLCTKRMVWLE
jgi:hypothetical protein